MKLRKILPTTYLFISIVIMVGLHFLLPLRKIIVFPFNLLGITYLALGIVINLIADREFKKHNTTVKPLEKSTALVTNGVFRVSRNPMYLGFVLILAGIAILMGSLSPFFIIIVFTISMDKIFIRTEEIMLQETFSDAWLEYKKRVRRWI